MRNICFIDGQNLYLGTQAEGWSIDNTRFRVYLKDKFRVDKAYYFLGQYIAAHQKMYDDLEQSGFILAFRDHQKNAIGNKKGNVDTDIVFEMMKRLFDKRFKKILLVSGDGDYYRTVEYLIEKNKFEKILIPNKKFVSSLYKKLPPKYYQMLGDAGVRKKIAYTKKKRFP